MDGRATCIVPSSWPLISPPSSPSGMTPTSARWRAASSAARSSASPRRSASWPRKAARCATSPWATSARASSPSPTALGQGIAAGAPGGGDELPALGRRAGAAPERAALLRARPGPEVSAGGHRHRGRRAAHHLRHLPHRAERGRHRHLPGALVEQQPLRAHDGRQGHGGRHATRTTASCPRLEQLAPAPARRAPAVPVQPAQPHRDDDRPGGAQGHLRAHRRGEPRAQGARASRRSS